MKAGYYWDEINKKRMYEIKIETIAYNGRQVYNLYIDGCYHQECTRIENFLKRGISLTDSAAIEKYLKYNNL